MKEKLKKLSLASTIILSGSSAFAAEGNSQQQLLQLKLILQQQF